MKDLIELPELAPPELRPMPQARRARARARNAPLILSFLILVVGPVLVSAWYLYARAADQYVSRTGFAVRTQEPQMPVPLFEGLGVLSGASDADADILYAFIHSPDMVQRVQAALDLRRLYSQPAQDPVFGFDPDAPFEALVAQWRRMVTLHYDSATGLIEVEARAFSGDAATAIAREILTHSAEVINGLSDLARDDTIRHARDDLAAAQDTLRAARTALTAFRADTQIVDPEADIEARMMVLGALQQALTETVIELDMLTGRARDGDHRVENLTRRAEVIRARIAQERRNFGQAQGDGTAYAGLIAQFETLSVDLEFAQAAYLAARAAYDTALREAQRQSRYLAIYQHPTVPQTAEYPDRLMWVGLVAFFAGLGWAVISLTVASLRDRA